MMNKFLLKNIASRWAGGAAVGLMMLGVFGSQTASAQIASTRHNLGSTALGLVNMRNSGTGEICVFCHTPHGADISVLAVPLWNRSLPLATSYTTYNSLGTSSLDGATVPVGSVSIACLSCHDGASAINVMINTPGSGSVALPGGGWSGTGGGVSAGGLMVGASTNLTTDLRNDHPIGIQYGGGMPAGGAYTTGVIAAGALKDTDYRAVQYASLNSQPVWWVDTAIGAAGTRQKTDMQLYTRTNATSLVGSAATGPVLAGAQAFVECASCHDPHTTNTTFLRISNVGSAVCLACHIK